MRGTCNGASLVGTLAPRRQGGYRLALNATVRRVAGGRLAFEEWPPGRRREVIAWLGAARRSDTRVRRAALVLRRLGLA